MFARTIQYSCLLSLIACCLSFERFLYGKKSCNDLIPIHSTELDKKIASKRPTTTGMDVEMFTSTGNYYAPGRNVLVTIVVKEPNVEGFMLQARSRTANGDIVGEFLDIPAMTMGFTCPNENENDTDITLNTIIDDRSPVFLSNVSVYWRAPMNVEGNIFLRLSTLIEDEYRIIYRNLQYSNLPPTNTDLCGVEHYCFRLCARGRRDCDFADTILTAIVRNSSDDSSINVIIGVKVYLMEGPVQMYGAIGFSKDAADYSQMDINACYSDKGNIQYDHLYLPSVHEALLSHQAQDIELESSFVDGKRIWCSFSRPFDQALGSGINLNIPTYFFFFTGYKDQDGFLMPREWHMRRTPSKIDYFKNKPFNIIRSVGKAPLLASLSPRALLCIAVGVHLLMY